MTEDSESALKLNKGIEMLSSIGNDAVKKYNKVSKKSLTTHEYYSGIVDQNISVLSRAITIIESSKPEHQNIARELIKLCLPLSGKSFRIGISGVPGVGKSTFIETLGTYITSLGRKIAVLAIDPSSTISKGSILGDKTRMPQLSVNHSAYIRPSPSAGSLGGVARKTRETIILCEAAGFDTIIIETVGVGQSETAVHSMVDFFLLLMLAGAGDELQGIKRGIMEMADLIVINKADGDNKEKAVQAKNQFETALHLFMKKESDWIAKVMTCSSKLGISIDLIWNEIVAFFEFVSSNNYLNINRNNQSKYWMKETITNTLMDNFYTNSLIISMLPEIEEKIVKNQLSSFEAAGFLLSKYYKSVKNV